VTSARKRIAAVMGAVGMLSLGVTPAALAASVGNQRAAAVARRAASERVERFGISCPPSAWKAACDRRNGGGWRCQVGTGGQCAGVVTVTGTSVRPRVRTIDVSCLG
jgi:hypothetical protein